MDQNILMRYAIIGFALLLSAGASAQTGFSTLEERMTGREFQQTGLHKLTEEELAALNRWIRQRSLAEGEVYQEGDTRIPERTGDPGADRRGLPADRGDSDRSPIRSRIVGTFSGWQGDGVFELENGMVWEQAEGGTFSSRTMENPEVEIRPGMLGGWYLRVDGYNTRVKVRRVK